MLAAALGGDDGFQLALFAGQLVKIRIRVGVGCIDLVGRTGAFDVADCLFDRFAYGLLRISFGSWGR